MIEKKIGFLRWISEGLQSWFHSIPEWFADNENRLTLGFIWCFLFTIFLPSTAILLYPLALIVVIPIAVFLWLYWIYKLYDPTETGPKKAK